MGFAKEVVLPAALSELLARLFSFALDNFPGLGGRERGDAYRRRLERLLGSIGGTVEEAEGRHITNNHLLSYLKEITDGMYRARFALEATDIDVGGGDEADSRRSLVLSSPFNSAKRLRVARQVFDRDNHESQKLAAAIEDLESLTRDCMREFVLLVQGYPRRVRRPVSTTLYMDRRVFGRHVETERVVNFLLQPAPAGAPPYLSVLPIIGRIKAGKTTLVRHACHDERLRGHFSLVECFQLDHVLREGGLPNQITWASDGGEYFAGVRCILGKERYASRRSLLIFEDAWPIDPSAWSAFAASPAAASLAAGSKLLLTSRDDNDNALLGTVEPVVLSPLPQEEYWYYFKAFAFSGMDAGDHPRMAAMGKEMARQLGGTFLGARMVGTLLRSKFDVRFWRRLMEAMVKCSGRRPCTVHVNFLLELLANLGQLQSYGSSTYPPRLTLRDALCNAAMTRSSNASGHLEGNGRFTIHLCRETLYVDHWYTITLGEE